MAYDDPLPAPAPQPIQNPGHPIEFDYGMHFNDQAPTFPHGRRHGGLGLAGTLLLGAAATLGAAALYVGARSRAAEAAHPPAGKFVEVDGVRLHVVERGVPTGRPLVLLHGLAMLAEDFLMSPFLELAARDHRILVFDRPGYGYSERPDDRASTPGEQARLIARDVPPEQVPHWIERAQELTCIELRRALERDAEAQMCARGEFNVWMPESIATLLKGTFRALRAAAKRWMWAEQCLVALAMHFIDVYQYLLAKAETLQRRIRSRDRYVCQVPGCSRGSMHAHHIIPKSRGGTDDDWNLVSLCVSHHLNGIHGGRIRVSGRAPETLTWEFDIRRSFAATAVA